MALALANKPLVASKARVATRPARKAVTVRAAVDTQLVIGGSTIAFLALGRFVFLPYQRRTSNFADTVGGPKSTGTGYFDNLSKPASFTLKTNDPAGFTIVDTMGWGALGHAIGFAALAAISLRGSI